MVEYICRKITRSKRMVRGSFCRKTNSSRHIDVKLKVSRKK